MNKNSKIYIAGHKGLVGSAITRLLQKEGYKNLILKTRQELDLLNQQAVSDLIYENLVIQANIMHTAYLNKVKKLLFLGSSCIYPKLTPQPIKEEYLLSGALETSNKPYAVAKIAGIITCQSYNKQYGTNFISVMPTNLYGPNDNFDLQNSHVLPALIRKFHEAKASGQKEIILWGSGSPKREFLYVDDLAEACLFLMKNYNSSEIINIGTGEDLPIKDLAEKIKEIAGYDGKIVWDKSKLDGTPRKLLDVSKITKLGWKHKIELENGLKLTYEWFSNQT